MDIFALTGAFLVGTAIIVPVIYLLSWLFGSVLWGTVSGIILLAVSLTRIKIKKIRLDTPSVLLLIFSLTFSAWMMFKTFHGGPDGQLFVGSNNVFDFGHSLGIIRSFSWGANIPMTSPFEGGLPFFYHFYFYFWVAILEYFGVPVVWAMNLLSILSFSALLIVVYYFPQIIAKQKPFVGWIAVLLTITNSSLTFWKLLPNFRSVWHLPTYPFAGPFDGSTISIFITLNNYINQRHLAFSIALGLFLILHASRRTTNSRTVLLGIFSGLLFLWNIPISGIAGLVIVLIFLLNKQYKQMIFFVLSGLGAAVIINIPNLPNIISAFYFIKNNNAAVLTGIVHPNWTLATYLWENLGLLLPVAAIGFVLIPKKYRSTFIPFVALFILESIVAGIGKRGFDQKFYSFLIIGINILAAVAIFRLWQRVKYVAVILLFVLSISGFVDLIPIKNEFAFPLIDRNILPVISWIHNSTPKGAVFVSYSDIIDPVVLAGRKNYFGFFGNIGWRDRSQDVQKIYSGDTELAKKRGISYILAPKWQKTDFPYEIHLDTAPTAYEDARYVVYTVK